MKRLAHDMMPPGMSMPKEMVEHLVDSQMTGSQRCASRTRAISPSPKAIACC